MNVYVVRDPTYPSIGNKVMLLLEKHGIDYTIRQDTKFVTGLLITTGKWEDKDKTGSSKFHYVSMELVEKDIPKKYLFRFVQVFPTSPSWYIANGIGDRFPEIEFIEKIRSLTQIVLAEEVKDQEKEDNKEDMKEDEDEKYTFC